MKDSELLDNIQTHASPHITLAYVIDNEGKLLSHFRFHPQIGEDITVSLDKISGNDEILLTTEDVRDFGNKLVDFADTVEAWIIRYYKREL